ncbi:MAG: response regulator transcription factor [Acidobacteria bacterium]|nr:response regulator transcription factor [Acidobacteriota bacterium]
MKPRVLIVGSDVAELHELQRAFAMRQYDARVAVGVSAAIETIRASKPALILTELDMPGGADGMDLCARVRESISVPVLVMSADTSTATHVSVLDGGAEDYLPKPLQTDVLFARVRLALRRHNATSEASVVGIGPFSIDYGDRRVRVRGQDVRLTPKEFDLFTFMAKHPNRVIPHKTLLGAVWGVSAEEQSEYLRVFVSQLRRKLEADPAHPRHLLTEPWVGYRFNPNGNVGS